MPFPCLTPGFLDLSIPAMKKKHYCVSDADLDHIEPLGGCCPRPVRYCHLAGTVLSLLQAVPPLVVVSSQPLYLFIYLIYWLQPAEVPGQGIRDESQQ